jgi:hypothetical protein
MLFYLRDFAELDGTIPAQFDALLDEQFSDLLRTR